MLLLLFAGSVMLCLGLVWVAVGLLAALPVPVLRCKACHYDLSGVDVRGVCPECGRSLAEGDGVYTAERIVRRPRKIVVGTVIAAVGLILFVAGFFAA